MVHGQVSQGGAQRKVVRPTNEAMLKPPWFWDTGPFFTFSSQRQHLSSSLKPPKCTVL